MRRSTVLILPPQIVFPAYSYEFCTSLSNFLLFGKLSKNICAHNVGEFNPSKYTVASKYKLFLIKSTWISVRSSILSQYRINVENKGRIHNTFFIVSCKWTKLTSVWLRQAFPLMSNVCGLNQEPILGSWFLG
jgi:hypothetical protein